MKYLFITILLVSSLFADVHEKNGSNDSNVFLAKKMSVADKKKRFYKIMAPAIKKVYDELLFEYNIVLHEILDSSNNEYINKLKKMYKVKTDKELLYALKPHSPSIVLAQAAMESSWATSRFFLKANNVFGIWSYNSKEPRIPALEKRGGKKTIWLKKFESIEDSVRAYYKTVARAKAYREFRELRYKCSNVYDIIKKLDKYSEMREKYPVELAKMIRYNKLTKYD